MPEYISKMPEYISKKEESSEAINFYIVTSVKGGCGKSSISFDLAFRQENSCIIDMDLLGSTWSLLANFADQLFISEIHDTKDFKTNLIWKKNIKDSVVSIVMNSNKKGEKTNYLNQMLNANTPEIETGIFKNVIIHLVEYLIELGYKNIIFDMPSSFDIYSGPIFSYLCKWQTKIKKKDDIRLKLHFVLVSPVTVIGVNSIYDWIYDYFVFPKDFSYITDIEKIDITVYFVDIFNINDTNLKEKLNNAIDLKMKELRSNTFKLDKINNILVPFSRLWYDIANKETPIESFEPFNGDIL